MRIHKLIVSSLVLLSLAVSPAWARDCSNPPSGFGNAWWSKYASWCRQCGGTPDSSTTSCSPGANWGGGGSSTGASQSFYRTGDLATDMSFYMMEQTLPAFFNAIGQQMACEFDPNCPRKVRQRQIEEQQRLEREARQLAAKEERQRQKLERHARFEQTKKRLLGEMRLQPGSGDLQPRHIGLETREVTGGLQTRTLAARDLSAGPTSGAASLHSPLARASCGTFLLKKSNEAAARDDYQEAAFLSNEAAALISGEKIISAVECPSPPEVPEVGAGRSVVSEVHTGKLLEIQATLQKRSRFVRSMYQRVATQGTQYRAVNSTVSLAEKRKQKAQLQLEKAQATKAEIKARQHHQPPSPVTDPAIESALAEALKTLQTAEADYAEADNNLHNNQKQLAALETEIQETRLLLDGVKQDPTTLDKALEKIAGK